MEIRYSLHNPVFGRVHDAVLGADDDNQPQAVLDAVGCQDADISRVQFIHFPDQFDGQHFGEIEKCAEDGYYVVRFDTRREMTVKGIEEAIVSYFSNASFFHVLDMLDNFVERSSALPVVEVLS